MTEKQKPQGSNAYNNKDGQSALYSPATRTVADAKEEHSRTEGISQSRTPKPLLHTNQGRSCQENPGGTE